MEFDKKDVEHNRMLNWLLSAFVLYGIAFALNYFRISEAGASLFYKFGHVTVAGFLGYRLDRSLFRDRMCNNTEPLKQLRRAILVGAVVLSISIGL